MSTNLMTGNSDGAGSDAGKSTDTTVINDAGGAPPAASWRDSLPADLKDHPSMQTFTSTEALAKSYVNAQSMIGRDKIVIPNEHSSDEDYTELFKKLGMPDADKYAVEGMNAEEKTEFDTQFTALMIKNHILPKQAKELYSFLSQQEKTQGADEDAEYEETVEQGITDLKAEWGNAFDENIRLANVACKTFGNEEIWAHLDETGMSNDPALLKLFAEVGKTLGEDRIAGAPKLGKNSPADAQTQIDSIMSNAQHAYNLPKHQGHDNAVVEMEKLFQDLTVAE